MLKNSLKTIVAFALCCVHTTSFSHDKVVESIDKRRAAIVDLEMQVKIARLKKTLEELGQNPCVATQPVENSQPQTQTETVTYKVIGIEGWEGDNTATVLYPDGWEYKVKEGDRLRDGSLVETVEFRGITVRTVEGERVKILVSFRHKKLR